ncbi:MAG: prohibitin family protein [Candidatus Marinimicrobia bacterium]|nr:prohibitin family protein [Candidatus Neomarinimicrobiota bacterium]
MRFLLFAVIAVVVLFLSVYVKRSSVLSSNLKQMGLGPGLLQGIAFIALLMAAFQLITIIDAGTVGVIKVFGKVDSRVLREGVNVRNPFADIIKMNIKTQERREEMRAPSKENLTVGLEISVIYHLEPSVAPEIVRTVGLEEDLIRKVLLPNFRSVVRDVTAKFEAKAVYASKRDEVAAAISAKLAEAVSERGIAIESTPLRDVILPQDLAAAIEEKLRAEQESQRMEFVLVKEQKEAARKRIEAEGIRDFNKTVAEGISDNFLRWKGIEATNALAGSNNAKVVVIGSGKDGLPIILGGVN